jgi:hypothetical protein
VEALPFPRHRPESDLRREGTTAAEVAATARLASVDVEMSSMIDSAMKFSNMHSFINNLLYERYTRSLFINSRYYWVDIPERKNQIK